MLLGHHHGQQRDDGLDDDAQDNRGNAPPCTHLAGTFCPLDVTLIVLVGHLDRIHDGHDADWQAAEQCRNDGPYQIGGRTRLGCLGLLTGILRLLRLRLIGLLRLIRLLGLALGASALIRSESRFIAFISFKL